MKPTAFPYDSRCPVHGNIPFNDHERRVIDHPFCQRLRHILQLGFASYVYVGATHHRLGHSIGVMHLASRLFQRLVAGAGDWIHDIFSPEDLRYFGQIVRFAGLLHDVGHPPFSHSSEFTLPKRRQLPLPQSWYCDLDLDSQATHEDFTIAIVHTLALESPAVFSLDQAQDICSLIDHRIEPSEQMKARQGEDPQHNILPLLRNLISSEIDADRMDYLHRDSHYAGVSYGRFDLDRMIRSLSCVPTENGIMMALEQSAVYTYENYLLARYHMFMQVYFHKTLLPFDYYLKQAFLHQEIDWKITGNLDEFLAAQDHQVFSKLWEARDQKWSSRIVYRKPSKKLFQFEHYHSQEFQAELRGALDAEGVEYLCLESKGYLSTLDGEHSKNTFLLKNRVFGKTKYTPVEEVSPLLKQYRPAVNPQYLYCDHDDYERACSVLTKIQGA